MVWWSKAAPVAQPMPGVQFAPSSFVVDPMLHAVSSWLATVWPCALSV